MIRRRWVVVVATVAGFAAVGVLLSAAQPDLYRSAATVVFSTVEQAAAVGNALGGAAPLSDRSTATLAQYARSDAVRRRAADEVDSEAGKVAVAGVVVTPVLGADALTMSAASGDASGAADAANAVANALATSLNESRDDQLRRAEESLIARSAEARAAARALAAELDGKVTADTVTPQTLELDQLTADFASLQAQLAQVRALRASGTEFARVSVAAVPAAQSGGPKPLQSGILGATIGLVLGIVLAFGVESTDASVPNAATAATLLGAPVLARLPLRRSNDPRGRFAGDAAKDELWSAAIALTPRDGGIPTVAVTAVDAQTPRGAIAIGLAEAFVRTGRRCVLIGADDSPGSASHLLSSDGESLDGVDLLTPVTDPDIALDSPAAAERTLLALKERYDAVVVDAPVVGADAGAIAVACDGVVVGVAIGQTGSDDLRRSREFLARIGAPVVGALTVATPA